MDRRNFLRSMLGVAAATALPSEVFPFRKIFLPPAPKVWAGTSVLRPSLNLATIHALELEAFSKQIPDLVYESSPMYKYFKKRGSVYVCTDVDHARKVVTFTPADIPIEARITS